MSIPPHLNGVAGFRLTKKVIYHSPGGSTNQ